MTQPNLQLVYMIHFQPKKKQFTYTIHTEATVEATEDTAEATVEDTAEATEEDTAEDMAEDTAEAMVEDTEEDTEVVMVVAPEKETYI